MRRTSPKPATVPEHVDCYVHYRIWVVKGPTGNPGIGRRLTPDDVLRLVPPSYPRPPLKPTATVDTGKERCETCVLVLLSVMLVRNNVNSRA
jgi:hypothetical protein